MIITLNIREEHIKKFLTIDEDGKLVLSFPQFSHVPKKLGYFMSAEEQKKFGYIDREIYIWEDVGFPYEFPIEEISKEPTWIEKVIELLKGLNKPKT